MKPPTKAVFLLCLGMKNLLTLLLFFTSVLLYSQEKAFVLSIGDTIKMKEELLKVIPENETILAFEVGKTTQRSISYLIVVTETQDPEANRIVYLFAGESKNTFNLHSKNSNIVECGQCGGAGVGDPFQGIEIVKNGFNIYIMYGACVKDSITISFRYDIKRLNWFLYNYTVATAYCNEINKDGSVKVTTRKEEKSSYGKVSFGNYNTE